MSDGTGSHACDPNDRYCRACGKPTLFYQAGLLPDYSQTETFTALRQAEADAIKPQTFQLMIDSDGRMIILNQEER